MEVTFTVKVFIAIFLAPVFLLGCSSEPRYEPSVFEGSYIGAQNPDDVLVLMDGKYTQGAGPDMRVGTYTKITETQPNMYQVTVRLTQPAGAPETDSLTIQVQDGKVSVYSNVSDAQSFYTEK